MNGILIKEELKKAIENLEAFTKIDPSCLLEVERGRIISVSESPLIKTIKLACIYAKSIFPSNDLLQEDKVFQAIVESSEIVKKHTTLLSLWECGSDEQRRFVVYAKTAINHFNDIIEQAQNLPSVKSHLFRFFYGYQSSLGKRLSKIEISPLGSINIPLATDSSTQYDPVKGLLKFALKAPQNLSKKIAQIRESFLPVQAKELFIMKAISLLEKNGIASHQHARFLVRESSIVTECNEEGIHILKINIEPYPGSFVEIRGAFLGRIPLPDRFQISIVS